MTENLAGNGTSFSICVPKFGSARETASLPILPFVSEPRLKDSNQCSHCAKKNPLAHLFSSQIPGSSSMSSFRAALCVVAALCMCSASAFVVPTTARATAGDALNQR